MGRPRDPLRSALVWMALAAAPVTAQEVTVRPNLPDDYVDQDFTLRLDVGGRLAEGERIAALIGDEDVSALLAPIPGGFRYRSELLGLPVGRHDLVVYRVGEDGRWTRLGAFPMKVRSGMGVEALETDHRLDLTFSAQPSEGADPAPSNPTDVPEVLDGKLQLGAELVHRDFTFRGTAHLVGTSEAERRLRRRELGEGAPPVDLSSYRLDHEQGVVALALGHVRAGGQRHLISGFGSRGATLTLTPGSRAELAVAANAGRQEVGWSNLLGVGDADHRVVSASMGVEALPTPGALRLEVGWMDGSILPRSGFNRGDVTDAETSSGMSARVTASGLDRRLRLDAGWARSTFDNPSDPELERGLDVVEVEETTKAARYLDASLDLLRGLRLGGSRTARLSVGYKHERVDPLYRTVAAGVRADNLQDQIDVRADVAGISVQGSLSRAEDNLDEIASILKSATERGSVVVGLPLQRILGGGSWLPTVHLRGDRTHQFGVTLPTNGGFGPDHVPDQVSVRRSLTVEWRAPKLRLGYQLDRSDQDNRQPGREAADFETLTNGVSIGLDPLRALQLGFDLGFERSDDLGAGARDATRRYGVNATWRPLDRSTLSLRLSDTFQDDEAGTREQSGRTFDARWSSRIPSANRLGGTYFVRYNRRESGRIDRIRDFVQDRRVWAVDVGASLGIAKGAGR